LFYGYAAENRVKLYDGLTARYIAEILSNFDNHYMNEAEVWIKKSIEADKRNDMMWNLASDYAVYGDLLKRQNDLSSAKENLNKAIKIFRRCGADGWVKKTEKELEQLL